MKKKRFWLLLLPIVTLILEILPFGAVCNFANPEGAPYRITYSYFDLTPFGNANFAPFLTALATCAMLLLVAICVFGSKETLLSKIETVNVVAILLSLCPLLFGITYYTVVGGMITASLVLQMAALYYFKKKSL